MQLLTNEKVIDIMERTLNYIDPRLMDHGKRVAYLMFKILWPLGKYTDKELCDICILAMLHDVGAYKTEEIDKMVIFETIDVWEHSIYGYLFLKHFSPLRKLASVILFHHAECDELTPLEPEFRLLAQLISLCDRADVFLVHKGTADTFCKYIQKYRGIKFDGDIVDMFLASGINIDTIYETIDTDEDFNRIFRKTSLSSEEVSGYIKMIIFSIDFRSSQTVIHTVASTCIALILAAKLGADEDMLKKIRTGAMLHDIGKIGIPIHILESTERLNEDEMKTMRAHIEITEAILDGNVEDEIKYIAARHHEKLNGTGYPNQLSAKSITLYERIVAVADIISALCGARSYKDAYPKEKVFIILEDMGNQNLIDREIVSLAIQNFDEIIQKLEEESLPVVQTYEAMNEERTRLARMINDNGQPY